MNGRIITRKSAVLVTVLGTIIGPAMAVRTANAIPAFARKYHVRCFMCHTVFPRLNKLGYEFKRLGYRMPPGWNGKKAPTPVRMISSHEPFKLADELAIFLRTDVQYLKDEAPDGTKTSTSSIDFAEGSLLWGGAIPDTNFSYFGEYVFYEDGESELERAKIDYTGGNVEHSYFVGIGKTHLQEGYMASDMHGLTDGDAPLMWTAVSPNNFHLAQNPGLVEGGYTYMSPKYKTVIGLTLKVTNGLDADGEGIVSGSDRKHKDVWFDGDFLLGNQFAFSVNYYQGKKEQIQNGGAPDEFMYEPETTRYGLYAHYLFARHLDVLAGFQHATEDWQQVVSLPVGSFDSNGYFVEADEYIKQGLVAWARYDSNPADAPIPSLAKSKDHLWTAGILKTLTELGNVKAYLEYSNETIDTWDREHSTNKSLTLGLDLGW